MAAGSHCWDGTPQKYRGEIGASASDGIGFRLIVSSNEPGHLLYGRHGGVLLGL
jgi:hypothetical protein